MTEQSTRLFDLLKRSSDFVIERKGEWDHSAWTEFVASVSRGETDLNAEMQAHLGKTLEAIKSFYTATASTRGVNDAMANIMRNITQFISTHKSVWGHAEWEAFIQTVQADTVNLNEQAVAYLGGILESSKPLYSLAPPQAGTKKAEKAPVAKKAAVEKKTKAPVKKKKTTTATGSKAQKSGTRRKKTT